MRNNIPARVGMSVEEVDTPCLMVDLDAFERNVETLGSFMKAHGLRHRAHAKTHKSSDIAVVQIERGGACGVCCQKVSEAEALVSAGIRDVLVSNQVVAPQKIDRLAALATRARVLVCVDDLGNVDDLSAAAVRYGVTLECLVEIDVGAGRCGVAPGEPAVAIARKIAAAPGLTFAGLQAYQGKAQHVRDYGERQALIQAAIDDTRRTVDLLKAEGLTCAIVAGAGTGSFALEGGSGVYNELQCGSYIFMDADYQRVKDEAGRPIAEFENSLFIYTAIMSKAKADVAICDAGLKAQSIDSGLPVVFGRDDVEYIKCSDEHGVISDPGNVLKLNDRLKLIPGHCDPTVNVYDWYVGVRNGRVEAVWPVTARGMTL
ncbi:DSD1 family PLP-dependent enzyme [Methylobacterium sp. J-070]|uniref:DSD1 family PLP-dependent enzyme n=1 Tax=Methylobacterium sp. J-070 TaxID=2836650 RepID=UPI001FBAF14A|nr:DSD1 family PLP-dependent enzyme [Methylobacterium sp. J-070]MCJ2050523.1 DSD1 family PLP-dependent enzyme [Methylobacterium sp. J-070]